MISFATFVWFCVDSERRAYRRSTIFNIAFVGLTVIVLPYYLVKSRGFAVGARAIGVSVLIYVVYAAATLLGVIFVRVLRI
jgi:hypothetical protein